MKINNEWLKDYEDFLNNDTQPSTELTQRVVGKIQKLLNPSQFVVFAKILGIHILIGTLSLAICNQFGLNPFNTEFSLSDWFMKMGGHNICMVFCGIFFISLSVLASGILLTLEEVAALRRHEFLQTLTLGVVSLGFLILFGAEVALGIGLLWLAGACLGGIAASETLWRIRRIAY